MNVRKIIIIIISLIVITLLLFTTLLGSFCCCFTYGGGRRITDQWAVRTGIFPRTTVILLLLYIVNNLERFATLRHRAVTKAVSVKAAIPVSADGFYIDISKFETFNCIKNI